MPEPLAGEPANPPPATTGAPDAGSFLSCMRAALLKSAGGFRQGPVGFGAALVVCIFFAATRDSAAHQLFWLSGTSIAAFLLGASLLAQPLTNALTTLQQITVMGSVGTPRVSKTGLAALDIALNDVFSKTGDLLQALQSAQKGAEDILERYRLVTENLAAAVVIRDPNGQIVYANPYTEVLTGYPLTSIIEAEDDFFAVIALDEDREKLKRSLQISAMGESFGFLFRTRHRSGMEMWLESRTEPVLNERGDAIFFLSLIFDVTRTMRYQRQVEEKNRDLQDFTYMVSHDLKAPIVTVKGMLSILEEESANLPESTRELLQHMHGAIQRLERLVASVLEYARVSIVELKSEELRLGDTLETVLFDLQHTIQAAGATVTISPALRDLIVIGEGTRLYQIFSNLIGNALKFRRAGVPPTIVLNLEHSKIPREILVHVTDNGLGIPADALERIFRPFQRAHAATHEGSGIGLASVRRLLEKIGGRVMVISEVGKGSTFTVALRTPAAVPPP